MKNFYKPSKTIVWLMVIAFSFSLSLVLSTNTCFSQTAVDYTYDASGNRITKRFHVGGQQKSAPAGSEVTEQPSEEKFIETLADTKITIYPNPTDARVKVQLENLPEDLSTKLYVYDIRGSIILSMSPLTNVNNIDLASYSPGIYFLKIFIGDKITQWEIIKH